MRKALVVGIDDYPKWPLGGCVNDANGMGDVLSKNEDGSPNFDCRLLVSRTSQVTRSILRGQIDELFAHDVDVALFYFSGHGYLEKLGGYLVTQDAEAYDAGIAMHDVLGLANNSKAREVVIILDCCYSGAVGNTPTIKDDHIQLHQGVAVLTASGADQPAMESGGSGMFTALVRSALDGGAADTLGNVTVAALYAYVDQLLGSWDQRPTFKTNVSRLTPLRRCKPHIDVAVLRKLPEYFVSADTEHRLDPAYEDTEGHGDAEKEGVFKNLQKCVQARLVVPVDEDYMYYAAVNSGSCKLTPLGQFYWNLARGGKL